MAGMLAAAIDAALASSLEGNPMPRREALTLVCALIVGIYLHATAQGPSAKTEARFVGGFNPDACRYPAEERHHIRSFVN
jgi:hypothetical protein